MALSLETSVYHKVDYSDLERYIAEVYKLDGFQILESSNDTTHEFDDIKKGELSEWDIEDVARFLQDTSAPYWNLSTLLHDMVNKDFIPEGSYLVRVSW